jgi:hypothetical protein
MMSCMSCLASARISEVMKLYKGHLSTTWMSNIMYERELTCGMRRATEISISRSKPKTAWYLKFEDTPIKKPQTRAVCTMGGGSLSSSRPGCKRRRRSMRELAKDWPTRPPMIPPNEYSRNLTPMQPKREPML